MQVQGSYAAFNQIVSSLRRGETILYTTSTVSVVTGPRPVPTEPCPQEEIRVLKQASILHEATGNLEFFSFEANEEQIDREFPPGSEPGSCFTHVSIAVRESVFKVRYPDAILVSDIRCCN